LGGRDVALGDAGGVSILYGDFVEEVIEFGGELCDVEVGQFFLAFGLVFVEGEAAVELFHV
jgi:hypothetical protein